MGLAKHVRKILSFFLSFTDDSLSELYHNTGTGVLLLNVRGGEGEGWFSSSPRFSHMGKTVSSKQSDRPHTHLIPLLIYFLLLLYVPIIYPLKVRHGRKCIKRKKEKKRYYYYSSYTSKSSLCYTHVVSGERLCIYALYRTTSTLQGDFHSCDEPIVFGWWGFGGIEWAVREASSQLGRRRVARVIVRA